MTLTHNTGNLTAQQKMTINPDTCLVKLIEYVKNNEADMVEAFLTSPAIRDKCKGSIWATILNAPLNADGDTLLIWASFHGYRAIVELLLADGNVNVLATDKYGFDAHTVAKHGQHIWISRMIDAVIAELPTEQRPVAVFEFADDYAGDSFNKLLYRNTGSTQYPRMTSPATPSYGVIKRYAA